MSSQPQVFVDGHLSLLISLDDPMERKRMKRKKTGIGIVDVDRETMLCKENAE